MAPARIGSTTHRRVFAADSLQVEQHATIDSIHGCGAPGGQLGGTAHNPAKAMVIPARADRRWQDRDRNKTSLWGAV
jgi:hypothetical protein